MRLDGFGLFVEDMAKMIRFYRDVLGFEIKESEDTSNVYLVKDGTLFLLYGRKDFENMTHRRYEYIKGLNGHSEIALYVDIFEEVDMAYNNAIKNGATSVLEPELERQMDLCVAYVLEHRDDLYWSMLDRGQFADHHLSTGKDWTEEGHCGSGGMPALSIDGNIYPCFRWLPHTQSGKEDAFVCGSADRGMYNKDAFRRVREGAYRASCTKEEKCRTCEYESACPYCIGGCFAEFGEFRRTTHICRITKIQCAAAEKYWQAYDAQGGSGK